MAGIALAATSGGMGGAPNNTASNDEVNTNKMNESPAGMGGSNNLMI